MKVNDIQKPNFKI